MENRLTVRIITILRTVGKKLSKYGGNRSKRLVNIYRFIVKSLLNEGITEIEINGSLMDIRMKREDTLGDIGMILVFDGKYETETTKHFKRLVKPDMNVIDVGANIGYYTLLSAKLVGSQGKVWAFEPEDDNFNDLKRNVLLNNYTNVVLIKKAVSDTNGMARFNLSKDSGGHSLIIDYAVDRVVEVETVMLDSVINERVDIIKTDTEGNELAVLKGANNILERNRDIKLFVEFQTSSWGTQLGLNWSDELLKVINSYGFEYLYAIDDWGKTTKNLSLEELKRESRVYRISPNVLCSRSELYV